MTDLLLVALLALAVVQLVLLLRPRGGADATLPPRLDELSRGLERLEREVRDELKGLRGDLLDDAGRGRDEAASRAAQQAAALGDLLGQGIATQAQRLEAQSKAIDESARRFDDGVARLRGELAAAHEALRAAVDQRFAEGASRQAESLDGFGRKLTEQTGLLEQRLEAIRTSVDGRLNEMRAANDAKLEQMRATVEEKLETTLEARLGKSFQQVSERLEAVHRGLGDMQNLAAGVGDLKRVLGNVKNRGTWGEYQLGALLEEILAPGQYETNVATRPGSTERVEFAVRFPGRDGADQLWLPIDSKFPLEDYQRLVEAQEANDAPAVALAATALEARVLAQAKEIRTKYVEPPGTTDFGILFVPVESLYAEILRRPGLFERLQRDQKVVVAGPTTLTALLGSFRMGFRTLALEKKSSEIREMLGAVRTEFDRFGAQLEKVKRKIDEAASTVDQMNVRSRAVQRKLKGVDSLPEDDAARVLQLAPGTAAIEDDDEDGDGPPGALPS